MSRIFALLVASIISLSFTVSAKAVDLPISWAHNGSAMLLTNDGLGLFTIEYSDPSNAIRGAGVRRGTVLIRGYVNNNYRVTGTARVFKLGCDGEEYLVSGSVSRNGDTYYMNLTGAAPVFGPGCSISGRAYNRNSDLMFVGGWHD